MIQKENSVNVQYDPTLAPTRDESGPVTALAATSFGANLTPKQRATLARKQRALSIVLPPLNALVSWTKTTFGFLRYLSPAVWLAIFFAKSLEIQKLLVRTRYDGQVDNLGKVPFPKNIRGIMAGLAEEQVEMSERIFREHSEDMGPISGMDRAFSAHALSRLKESERATVVGIGPHDAPDVPKQVADYSHVNNTLERMATQAMLGQTLVELRELVTKARTAEAEKALISDQRSTTGGLVSNYIEHDYPSQSVKKAVATPIPMKLRKKAVNTKPRTNQSKGRGKRK